MNWSEAVELTRKLKKKNSGEAMVSVVGFLIGVAIVFLFAIPLAIYFVWANAFVIEHMWRWFIVSTFAMDPLTMSQAWGLAIIVSYLTHTVHTCKSKDERETTERVTEIVVLFLKPWAVLGGAYICAHWFMKVV